MVQLRLQTLIDTSSTQMSPSAQSASLPQRLSTPGGATGPPLVDDDELVAPDEDDEVDDEELVLLSPEEELELLLELELLVLDSPDDDDELELELVDTRSFSPEVGGFCCATNVWVCDSFAGEAEAALCVLPDAPSPQAAIDNPAKTTMPAVR